MFALSQSLEALTTRLPTHESAAGRVFTTEEREMERHLWHAAAPSAFISAPVGIIYGPIRPWALPVELTTNPYIKASLESIKQVVLRSLSLSFSLSASDLFSSSRSLHPLPSTSLCLYCTSKTSCRNQERDQMVCKSCSLCVGLSCRRPSKTHFTETAGWRYQSNTYSLAPLSHTSS